MTHLELAFNLLTSILEIILYDRLQRLMGLNSATNSGCCLWDQSYICMVQFPHRIYTVKNIKAFFHHSIFDVPKVLIEQSWKTIRTRPWWETFEIKPLEHHSLQTEPIGYHSSRVTHIGIPPIAYYSTRWGETLEEIKTFSN